MERRQRLGCRPDGRRRCGEKSKPPAYVITRIRTNVWEVVLKDGTRIPPHGKIDTFVLVKQGDAWRIAAMNIHNQMPRGRERPGERVPLPTKQPPESNAR